LIGAPIFPEQFGELRPEDHFGCVIDGRDPNGGGGLVAKFAYGLKLGLDLFTPWVHGVKQAFARLRRRNAARGAGQQPNTEPFLEATNGMAERGLRNAQLRCGFGEAALSSDGQEGQEVVQICALH
jgi:hypothetical protein